MDVQPDIVCNPGEIFNVKDGYCYTAATTQPTFSCPSGFTGDGYSTPCVKQSESLPLNIELFNDELYKYDETVFACPEGHSYDILSNTCLRNFFVDFSISCEKDFIMQEGECVAIFVSPAMCADGSHPSSQGNCPVYESKKAKSKCPKDWKFDLSTLECYIDDFIEPAISCGDGGTLIRLSNGLDNDDPEYICRQITEYVPVIIVEDKLNKHGQKTGHVKEHITCANGGKLSKVHKTCSVVVDSDVLLSCPEGTFVSGARCVSQRRVFADLSCPKGWLPSYLPNAPYCYIKYFEDPWLCPKKYDLSPADKLCVRVTVRSPVEFCPTGYSPYQLSKFKTVCARTETIAPILACKHSNYSLFEKSKKGEMGCRKLDNIKSQPYINLLRCKLGWELDATELVCKANEAADPIWLCPPGFEIAPLQMLHLDRQVELPTISLTNPGRRLRGVDQYRAIADNMDEDSRKIIGYYSRKLKETNDSTWQKRIDKLMQVKYRRLQRIQPLNTICVSPTEKRNFAQIICPDGSTASNNSDIINIKCIYNSDNF